MKKIATLFLGAALLLGACSSGSSASTKQSNPPDTSSGRSSNASAGSAQLKVAAKAFVTALMTGDAESAHPLFTARCRESVSTKNLKTFLEKSIKDYEGVTVTGITAKIKGDSALVDYNMSDPDLSRLDQHWMIEDGTWHNDDC